jgi:hypothetical protein
LHDLEEREESGASGSGSGSGRGRRRRNCIPVVEAEEDGRERLYSYPSVSAAGGGYGELLSCASEDPVDTVSLYCAE